MYSTSFIDWLMQLYPGISTIGRNLIVTLEDILPEKVYVPATYEETEEICRLNSRRNQKFNSFQGDPNREYFTVKCLEEVADIFIKTLVASEDRRFFQHAGTDYIGIALVGIKTLASIAKGNMQIRGSSTIEEQLMKLTLQDPYSKSRSSRLKRIRMAAQLNRNFSAYGEHAKQSILLAYLNSVDFGNCAIGISEAAHYYFRKGPEELSIAESSVLAVTLRNPRYFNPLFPKNPGLAYAHNRQLLLRMEKSGIISHEEAKDALQETYPLFFKEKPMAPL